MPEAESGASGLLGSLRRMATSLLALLQTRVQLVAIELQEEKLRAINLLVWLTVALALGVAGILVSVGILSVFLWQRAGFAGVIGLAVVLLAAAIILLLQLRRRIVQGPDPFATTIQEIGKDLAVLRGRE
jgi:uncharacterized membrane protein YqjE